MENHETLQALLNTAVLEENSVEVSRICAELNEIWLHASVKRKSRTYEVPL